MNKFKTIFMGTPEFSVPTLAALFQNPNIEISKVITMPDRPAGRGKKLSSPEVALFANKNNIPLLQTENVNKELSQIDPDTDLIIVLAFAQFLGEKILNLPKLGCFNIHTSLLPKYRGAAPIQYALLNGDKQTGVSIQKMVKKMDAGDICHSKTIDIESDETGGTLYKKLMEQSALEINNFIEKLKSGKLIFEQQDETHISFAPVLKKADGYLKFSEMKKEDLVNRLKALDPWPGTYCFLNSKRLKIFELEEVKLSKSLAPGKVDISNNQLLVGCLDSTLRISKLQMEGRKPCSDIELLNGLINSNSEIQLK